MVILTLLIIVLILQTINYVLLNQVPEELCKYYNSINKHDPDKINLSNKVDFELMQTLNRKYLLSAKLTLVSILPLGIVFGFFSTSLW
jgi:hypothetical protein